MDELLKKLLEAEILTTETKEELSEAFSKHIEKALAEAKEETETQVRADLTEQWIKEREVLIEAIDGKVGQYLEAEVSDLKEDVSRFRDLEAEFAEKIVESRASMAEELKDDMAKLVESIDGFLKVQIDTEFKELHEDIEEVKKNQFGRKIFESFMSEFNNNFIDEESTQAKLHEATAKLIEANNTIEETTSTNSTLLREAKMNELLAPLNGYQKEVMGTILQPTATEKLDETYKKFIGRIMKESVEHSSEKESTVLAESEDEKQSKNSDVKLKESKIVIKSGDTAESKAEALSESVLSETDIAALRRMSGIR